MSSLKNMKRYRSAEPEEWEQRATGKLPRAKSSSSAVDVPVKPKKKLKTPYQNWLIPGAVGLGFLLIIGFAVKVFMSDDGGHKKAAYQVTLIKPPPPEENVKPPEPEPPKETPKESIPTPAEVPQQQAQNQDQPPDNAPPGGNELGVEGDGSAGSDGFGLRGGIKNGRSVTIGGGGGGMNRLAMLTKFGWYTSKIQEDIKKQLKRRMDKDGGMPKGKYEITLKILLDQQGTIKKYRLVTSSGNNKLDDALKASLPGLKISQAPPEGMPSLVTLRIQSQG